MATLIVNACFHDAVEDVTRDVGDTFEASDERVAQLMERLPGYVTVVAEEEKPRPRRKARRTKE